MKYLLSIVILLIMVIVISLIYYSPATPAESPTASTTLSISMQPDMDFFDCLEYSHEVTGEGVLAREAALQAFFTKAIDFIGLQAKKVADCF